MDSAFAHINSCTGQESDEFGTAFPGDVAFLPGLLENVLRCGFHMTLTKTVDDVNLLIHFILQLGAEHPFAD